MDIVIAGKSKKSKNNKLRKGSALTELLFYLGIMAIVMTLFFVGGTAAIKSARKTAVQNTVRNARVNIVQLVNETDLYNLPGADADAKKTRINNLINTYFEAEMACSVDTITGDGIDVTGSNSYAYAGLSNKKDPWGENYRIVINNLGKGEVVIAFVSCGADRTTTLETNGKIGSDDTGLIVHIFDSNALYYTFEGAIDSATDGNKTDGHALTNLKDCKLQNTGVAGTVYVDMSTDKWATVS